jgi:toxin-antitoxin system PIN domain toxin
MITVDTNVLVYAHREDSEFHERAKQIIESLRQTPAVWAVPWPCIHEFISIVTHPRIYRPPTSLEQAFATVDSWMSAGNLELIAESGGYLDKLRTLSSAAKLSGARIHDARIAALCLHHGVHELWTADRDFSCFPQVKTRNPLVKT